MCSRGQWLVDSLESIGMTNGEHALPFSEITAWADGMGLSLTAWEMESLRGLSQDFLTAWHEGQEKNAPIPWIGPITKGTRSSTVAPIVSGDGLIAQARRKALAEKAARETGKVQPTRDA